jgi:hypothetical protein
LQCMALPRIREVFPGSPRFSSFSTLDHQF